MTFLRGCDSASRRSHVSWEQAGVAGGAGGPGSSPGLPAGEMRVPPEGRVAATCLCPGSAFPAPFTGTWAQPLLGSVSGPHLVVSGESWRREN